MISEILFSEAPLFPLQIILYIRLVFLSSVLMFYYPLKLFFLCSCGYCGFGPVVGQLSEASTTTSYPWTAPINFSPASSWPQTSHHVTPEKHLSLDLHVHLC